MVLFIQVEAVMKWVVNKYNPNNYRRLATGLNKIDGKIVWPNPQVTDPSNTIEISGFDKMNFKLPPPEKNYIEQLVSQRYGANPNEARTYQKPIYNHLSF